MPEAPVPKVIADRYELGTVLGRGGMGEVRDGLDRRLGRPVAVKLLRSDMAVDPELRRRFEAEARAAAGLAHPNVVAVHDTGEQDGVPYIVMERLAGRTVADEIAEGPLEPARVRRVAREVLAALDVAHRAGVVHRDIKPGNLLLTPDSSVKVGDFGIAKAAETQPGDLTATGQVIGTPAYLAPERLEGRPATARSDLYSLGVVLYEALSGAKPYSGDTPWGLGRAIADGRHRPLAEMVPGCPQALVATVERAMTGAPDDRFATAADMAAALDDVGVKSGGVATTVAVPSSPPDSTEHLASPAPGGHPRTGGGRPGAARRWLGVAVVAVVLLGGALFAVAGRDRSPANVSPSTTSVTPGGSIPEPLDRAIDQLEESVRP
jgi:serine/threonine protein kinase